MSCSKGEGGVSYLQILVCTKTRITKFGVVSNQSATWFSLTIRLHFSKRSLSTAACDIIFTSRTDLASSQATVVGKQNIEHLFGWTRDVLWFSLANTNQGYRNAAVCDLLKAEKKQDISYVLPLILFKLCIKINFNISLVKNEVVTRSELVEVEIRGLLPPANRVITEERYRRNYLSMLLPLRTHGFRLRLS